MKKRKKPPTEQELSEIIDRAQRMPFKQRVKIAHHLNRYEWIDELPGKPESFEEMNFEEKDAWISPIYQYMSGLIGDKALLRYFHTTELGRTDQEFEDWWDSMHHDSLSMFKQKNHNIEDYSAQRANNGTNKRNPQIMPFLIGYFIGSIVGELTVLFLDIIGVL